MVTKQQHVDRLSKSLVLFVGVLIVWLLLEQVAGVVDPAGILSLVAGILFLGVVVTFVAVVALAASFYSRIK